jgi:hypothetical protein
MADESQVVRGVNWREAFPFTHLFRAFRIAIHPSKLVLGLVLLLTLYTGGRILDGLWPARHLAVPNEVEAYEQARERGAGGEFAAERRELRRATERAYAQRLLAEKIVTDPAAAREEAEEGDELDELQERIEQKRNTTVTEAEKGRDASINDARTTLNGAERDRAIREAEQNYRDTVRAAYAGAYADYRGLKAINGAGIFSSFFEYETRQVSNIVRGVLGWNWLGGWMGDSGDPGVVRSIINFFTVGPLWLMRFHPFYFILFTLLFLTLWAIFGGAIARIAAVHVARDEKISVRAALQFSIGKFLSFVSAPLIPLLIVLLVGLIPIAAGLLGSIPLIGPVFNLLLGALFILVLAAGFVMTLVLVGTFGGFNLMYPTIAAEGSDSFDAISRSFSYVYARPWRMLLYTLIAIIYGALTYLFVRLFIALLLAVTHQFVDIGHLATAASGEPLWNVMWPGVGPQLSYDIDFMTLRWDQDLAAAMVAFWVYLVIGTLGAYAISYYFSANTIIYYLMRQEVDATELDDVYLEMSDEDFADTPPVTSTATGTGTGATASTPASASSGGGVTSYATPSDTAGGTAPAGGAPAGSTDVGSAEPGSSEARSDENTGNTDTNNPSGNPPA